MESLFLAYSVWPELDVNWPFLGKKFRGKWVKNLIFPSVVGFHMTLRYFHDALVQLKTNFHTNLHFKRVLGVVIEYAWISKLLHDAAFAWRPREQSWRLKKMTYFKKFCYLNSSCSRKNISLMSMSFSKNKFNNTALFCSKTR